MPRALSLKDLSDSYDLPAVLIDVISQEILEDPVIAEDGHTYSRKSILSWFEDRTSKGQPIISPWTRERMGSSLQDNEEIGRCLAAISKQLDSYRPQHEMTMDISNPIISVKYLGNIFKQLDSLGPLLADILPKWDPPKVAVIGNESSGKSSILERLAMMSIFPRGEDICTRLPIHVQLRYAEEPCMPTLSVLDSTTHEEIEPTTVLPSMDAAHVDVKYAMSGIIQQQCGQHGGVCMDQYLMLHVSSPNVPSIDLIDLPGIVAAGGSLPTDTRCIVEHYIESNPNSLFLAVVEAGSRFSCSPAMEFVQKYDLHARTIGVVTKCDLISRKAIRELRRSVMQDVSVGSVPLHPHGYVCTMNAGDDPHDEEESQVNERENDDDISALTDGLEESSYGAPDDDLSSGMDVFAKDQSNYGRLVRQARSEPLWFKRNGCSDLLSSGTAGTASLVGKLNRMYLDYMSKNWVPATLQQLLRKKEELLISNGALGLPILPRSDMDDVTLTKVVFDLQNAVMTAIEDCLRKGLSKIQETYSMDILNPLLHGILDTSVKNVEVSGCLNPANHIEEYMHRLRTTIDNMCRSSIEKAKSFWGSSLKSLFMEDTSSVRLGRFIEMLEYMSAVIDAHMKAKLSGLASDIGSYILRQLGVPNCQGGVNVRYSFQGGNAEVTITWDATDLAHTVMFVFTRLSRLLPMDEIESTLKIALNTYLADGRISESCADERSRLHADISNIDSAIRGVVRVLINDCDDTSNANTKKIESSSKLPLLYGLKEAGLDALVLKEYGFTISQLREGNFTARELISLGYAPALLYQHGFTLAELRECGTCLGVIASQCVLNGHSLEEMVALGFTYSELREAGCDLVDILSNDAHSAQLMAARSLMSVHFSEQDAINICTLGGLSQLVAQIQNENSEIRLATLRVLHQVLSCQRTISRAVQDVFVDSDMVPKLVKLLNLSGSDAVYFALSILEVLSSVDETAERIANADGLSILVQLLHEGNAQCKSKASAILFFLGEKYIDRLIEADIVVAAVHSLATEELTDTTCATSCLGIIRMIIKDAENCVRIVKANGISPVVAMMNHEDEICCEFAVDVVRQLAFHKKDYKEELVAAGVLHRLIKLLSHPSIHCREYTVISLSHFCRVSKYRKAILESDCVSDIVGNLDDESTSETKIAALAVLRNLGRESQLVKSQIMSYGISTHLVSMLSPLESDAVREASASTIGILSGEDGNSITLAEAGVILPLVDMLNERNYGCQEMAAGALRSLACIESNRIAIAAAGAIEILVDILRCSPINCKTMAARALRNLAFNSHENKAAIAKAGGIEMLIEMLQYDNDTCRAVAAGVLQNISYKHEENQYAVIYAGALEHLLQVLRTGGASAKEEACGTLRNLAVDPGNAAAIMRSDAVSLLAHELESGTKSSRDAAAETLRTLCSNEVHREHIKLMGITAKAIRYKSKKW